MDQKIVLITGGNAGIGKQTAISLAQKGAIVVIVSRNLQKGEKAVEEIRQKSGSQNVDLLTADLSSLQSVRDLTAAFKNKYQSLDVLVNNAGCILTSHSLTTDGYELQFGVNHLSHFLLTHLLLDYLEAATEGRIVNVSSMAHYTGKLDFDALTGNQDHYDGMAAYRCSKLCNVLFTREFGRRFPDSQVTANCLHPGVVKTRIGNKSNLLFSLVWTIMKPFMLTEKRGAKTSIFLASSPKVKGVTGQYFNQHQKEKTPSDLAQDEALAAKLWEYSLAATGLSNSK
ncbi:MAG: SDR family oxidoreductase [Bacteroidota bacterium]